MSQSKGEPTAGLIIIGAEVLSGKVDDVNGPFLIGALRAHGVEVRELRIIGDAIGAISDAVRALAHHNTHVFTTGGIGPTHDDVTIGGVAHAFERAVVKEPNLIDIMQRRHPGPLSEARQKMAEVPQGAEVFLGDGSFVPVVRCQNVYILPGVPSLMRACFAALANGLRGTPFCGRALLLDVSESDIAAILTAVQAQYPDLTIGSYPRFDDATYRVKVTVDGRTQARVDLCLACLRDSLPPAIIVGEA